MATEQDILDFVSELEAERAPDSLGLASLAPGNDIPAKREKLAVLASTGKANHRVADRLLDRAFQQRHEHGGED